MLIHRLVVSALLSVTLIACGSMGEGSKAEKRQEILNMKDAVLNQLYATHPNAREEVSSAPGYGVFTNANLNLFLISAGTGYGVVKNMRTGHYTYMNMVEGGIGLGLGAKSYRIVMIFHTADSMRDFIASGWTFGGNADATAKAEGKGGAVAGEVYYGDVSIYTFTETGLALQATVNATKFWQDDELN